MRLLPRRDNSSATGSAPPLHPIKLRAIDAAFERFAPKSVADLGGVWAVDGGYSSYMLDRYELDRLVLIDESPTQSVVDQAARQPSLTLIAENFGSRDVVRALGPTGLVVLFDVLLHQVAPDWDEVLQMYSEVTETFVIVNPQYVEEARTVRLLDLGREEYKRLVPPQPGYEDAFDRLDEFLPERGRAYRDIHNIWQWGITPRDLNAVMSDLGYELTYFENAGQWQAQPAFENHAYIFSRIPCRDSGSPENDT